MSPSPTPAHLASLLSDEPRWIDLKGLLISARCDIWTESEPVEGFVARSWDYPFAAIHATPGASLIRQAVEAGRSASQGQYLTDEWQLLAPPSSRATVEVALPGWRRRGVQLFRWGGGLERPDLDVDVRIDLLPDGHGAVGLTFDHVPATTRHEYILDWVSRRPMTVAIVDSLPVTFCYAAFTTDTLWDVSIETIKPYRRHGLAAACFLTLARHMAEQGLIPAWGAMEDNPGSLGLAAKLGFERDAEIDAWYEILAKRP
ncbi:MAG: GNAT family N-acetyltransferase [Thermoanaerobaculia bacterium]